MDVETLREAVKQLKEHSAPADMQKFFGVWLTPYGRVTIIGGVIRGSPEAISWVNDKLK